MLFRSGFRPGRGTTDQLFTLARILEGAWEYAHPVYMCFVDLEKAYDRVLREYGVRGSLLRAIQSLYSQSESCVASSAASQFRSQWVLVSARAAPCHQSRL